VTWHACVAKDLFVVIYASSSELGGDVGPARGDSAATVLPKRGDSPKNYEGSLPGRPSSAPLSAEPPAGVSQRAVLNQTLFGLAQTTRTF